VTGRLVEVYLPSSSDPANAARRARAAAEALSARGRHVQYVRSLFLPSDETCFLVFDAEQEADVREVLEQAGIGFQRIVEAVHVSGEAYQESRR
jgi:hypothetical protein